MAQGASNGSVRLFGPGAARRAGRMLAAGLTLAALLFVIPARADVAPPHLVGLAKSLIGQLEAGDFADLPDPALAGRVRRALAQARIRNWAGEAPSAPADTAKLAATLGLDPNEADQRAKLDAVLAARNRQARERAIADALAAAGRPVDPDAVIAARQALDAELASQLGDKAETFSIPAGDDGETLNLVWDPTTSSFTATVDLGEELGEVALHGGAAARIEDGRIVYDVEADEAPVTYVSPEGRRRINRLIFGVWTDGDGGYWAISPPDGEATPEPAVAANAARARELEELRARLQRLERERVHVWRHPNGGEVIQTGRIKRLPEPYIYDRERSQSFNKAEIDRLRARISELDTDADRPPVYQHDPLGTASDPNRRQRRPIRVEVTQKSGWRFAYDEAHFDGVRVTASRTLRDVRDISDLPANVISQLVRSWSPPEWIELKVDFDPREKTVSLGGKWWRLHVTYSGISGEVSRIHTPYSRPLRLAFEDDEVQLRIVDLDGAALPQIAHDQPFRIEARYLKEPDDLPAVVIDRAGEEADEELVLSLVFDENGDIPDRNVFRSDILYARSAGFSGRRAPEGLYRDERFVDLSRLEAAKTEFRTQTQDAARQIRDNFAGAWQIFVKNEAASPDGENVSGGVAAAVLEAANYIGEGHISADGRQARMTVAGDDGVWVYRSVEMKPDIGNGFANLEIRFKRAYDADETFPDGPPGLEPLPRGRVLYFKTLTPAIHTTLDGARAYSALDLEPPPEFPFRVTLRRDAKDRLNGRWRKEERTGHIGDGGLQTWARNVKFAQPVLLDRQRGSPPPVAARYPFGADAPSGASKKRWLFVFGENLPVGYNDAVLLESESDGVAYRHYPLSVMAPERVAAAWRRAGVADPSSCTGLFLEATIGPDVRPGTKNLTLNGAGLGWRLDYSDNVGRAYFVDGTADRTPTSVIFESDVAQLELIADAPIPYGLPLKAELALNDKRLIEVPLQAATDAARASGRERLYRSPPLHFYRSDRPGWGPPAAPDAVLVDLASTTDPEAPDVQDRPELPCNAQRPAPSDPPAPEPRAEGERRLTGVTVGEGEEPPEAPTPRPATARVFADPDELGESWRGALLKAAACYSPRPPLDPKRRVHSVSKFILTELGSRSIELTLGDHAAGILIRDEFADHSTERATSYRQIAEEEAKLDQFINAGVRTRGASDPFWTVWTFNVGDNAYPATDLLYPGGLAAQIGETRELALRFRKRALPGLLRQYAARIQTSIDRARGTSNCNFDELLVIAGHRADPVVRRIFPRLVLVEETNGKRTWVPDLVARGYVRTLYIPGEAVRALEAYAAIDDAYKGMALALAGTGGAFLIASTGRLAAAAYFNLAFDVADAAWLGMRGWNAYQKSEEFFEFSAGAAASYGADFYENAAAGRQSGFWAGAGVLLPGLGALSSLKQLRQVGRFNRGAAIAGRMGDDISEAALEGLTRSQKADLFGYLNELQELSRLRAVAGNVGRARLLLSKAKRRLLDSGRRITDADEAFMAAWQGYTKARAAAIDAGARVAAKLDIADEAALAGLSRAQRVNLAKYVDDIVARQDTLASGKFSGRVRGVSAREAELVRRLGGSGDAVLGAGRRAGAADNAAAGARGGRAADDALDAPAPRPRRGDGPPDAERPRGDGDRTADAGAPERGPSRGRSPPDDEARNTADDLARGDDARRAGEGGADAGRRSGADGDGGRPRSGRDGADPAPGARPPPRGFDAEGATPRGPGRAAPPPPPANRANAQPQPAPQPPPPPAQPTQGFRYVDPATGQSRTLELGDRITEGGYNAIYRVKGDDTKVVRVSLDAADSAGAKLDEFGRNALRGLEPDIVVPTRHNSFTVEGQAGLHEIFLGGRAEVVDFVPWRASDQLKANGGRMTPGQLLAYDRATRALNKRGLAWLDNHAGNFGFKPVKGRPDEWQVIIFDTGGVVRMQGDAATAARSARALQRALNDPPGEVASEFRRYRNAVQDLRDDLSDRYRRALANRFGDQIDVDGINRVIPGGEQLASGRQVPFRADGPSLTPEVGDLARITDPAELRRAYDALASGRYPDGVRGGRSAGASANAGTPRLADPVLPGTPRPRADGQPGTPRAGTPRLSDPDLPGTPRPRADGQPGTPRAGTPRLSDPDLPGTPRPRADGQPGTPRAGTPRLSDPDLPGTPRPRADGQPGTPRAGTPRLSDPDLPGTPRPRAGGQPGTPRPGTPRLSEPDLPATPRADAAAGAPAPVRGTPARPRQVGTVVEPPGGLRPVFRQEKCNTCGVAAGRTVIARAGGEVPSEDGVRAWSRATGRGYDVNAGGTYPRGMIDILEEAGLETRIPYGRSFPPGRNTPTGAVNVSGKAALGDAAAELRRGNQVLAVVDYARGPGQPVSPHWVTIEKVGRGKVTRGGKTVIDGPYVIVGDPARGVSVAISEADFLRHWRRQSTIFAGAPRRGGQAFQSPPGAFRATGRRGGAAAANAGDAAPAGGRFRSAYNDNVSAEQLGWRGGSNGGGDYRNAVLAMRKAGLSQAEIEEVTFLLDLQTYQSRINASRSRIGQIQRRLNRLLDLKIGNPALRQDVLEFSKRRIRNAGVGNTPETFDGRPFERYEPPDVDFPSTTPQLRAKAKREKWRDPYSAQERYFDPTTDMEADHIYPVSLIKDLPGFDQLKNKPGGVELQKAVVHDPANIQGLPRALNNSKSNHLVKDWPAARLRNDEKALEGSYLDYMRQRQDAAQEYLQKLITCLNRRQLIDVCRKIAAAP